MSRVVVNTNRDTKDERLNLTVVWYVSITDESLIAETFVLYHIVDGMQQINNAKTIVYKSSVLFCA